MDILSDILKKVKLSSAVYFESDFSSPWGMTIPKSSFSQFHIVTKGQCIMKTEIKTIQLLEGDIIVFPFGTNHSLLDLESSKCKSGQEVVEGIMNGKPVFIGENISTRLVCGHFKFDTNIEHPFIKELPIIIHISGIEKKKFSWLESITNLIIQEAGSENSGKNIIVNKLGEVLFIHVLRAYMQKNSKKSGFIAAMQDERIGKVLKSLHQKPELDWQVNSMAKIAGMSRTSFSNHFKKLTGVTPFNYITQWRILEAIDLLRDSNKSVSEIAEKVGYLSEAAFNRVFKKRVEHTPLKFRQLSNDTNVSS
jgi:AraC-like DNA-binding protein